MNKKLIDVIKLCFQRSIINKFSHRPTKLHNSALQPATCFSPSRPLPVWNMEILNKSVNLHKRFYEISYYNFFSQFI